MPKEPKVSYFITFLDGINERRDFQRRRSLIDCLVASPWRNSVAVLITCRDRYWQSTFGSLRYLSTNTCKLPSYSEEELTEALKANNIDRAQLSSNLFSSELIYKPRYFDTKKMVGICASLWISSSSPFL